MKDAEGTIERLLQGLRDAEPPAGIERRILRTLDGMGADEASGFATPSPRPKFPSWLRPAMVMPLACALILIVSITNYQHRHATPDGRSLGPQSGEQQATSPEAVTQKAPTMPRRMASRVPVRPPRTHAVPAEGETQEASFPAPPLPLTEQERLLLRLAHRGDAENMAVLNPDVQAVLSAKATKEFQQFFEIDATEMRSESE